MAGVARYGTDRYRRRWLLGVGKGVEPDLQRGDGGGLVE